MKKKVCGHLTMTRVGHPKTVATKFDAYNCIQCCSLKNLELRGPNLFQHANAPVNKARHGLPRFLWKNLMGLHRTLISNPLNTTGMNQNDGCTPGFLPEISAQPFALLLLNDHILTATVQKLVESLLRRVMAVAGSGGGDLEWDFQYIQCPP